MPLFSQRRTVAVRRAHFSTILLGIVLCLLLTPSLWAQSRAPALSQLLNTVVGGGQSGEGLSASVRIGLSYVDDETNSGDYRLEDFDSRIGWQGSSLVSAGINADGYIELGVRQEPEDEFGLAVRELWAGLSGPWGALRLGNQYSTFYELVSSPTDVAVWGSCWTQLECERKSQVIKYTSPAAPLVLGFSLVSTAEDIGNDAVDQFEYGLGYQAGNFYLGLAGSGFAEEAQFSGGNLFGAVITFGFSGGALSLGYQQTDAEAALDTEFDGDLTNLTVSLTYGSNYVIYNQGEIGDANPTWLTVGARYTMASGSSLFYEYQQVDSDSGDDEENFIRAGLIVDW